MSERWRAWQALLPVWLPVVLVCVLSVLVYVWLSSESLGRKGQLRDRLDELETRLDDLARSRRGAVDEAAQVTVLEKGMEYLYEGVFGSLDERLTDILRAVGGATRNAGLLPGRFSYSADKKDELKLVRFGVRFGVSGQYAQVRRMLTALQASEEFLIVDHISLAGEEGATTTELRIAVNLATYLARVDQERLDELLGRDERTGER